MTSAQEDPANSSQTRRDESPPPQQPPPYSHEAVVELPGDAPDSSIQQGGAQESSTIRERPRTKPEGSAYASSYRPQDRQDNPPVISAANEHHGVDTEQDDHGAATPPEHPPPAYTEIPGTISDDDNRLGANAVVANDGRVNIRINQKDRALSQLVVPQLQRQLTQIEHEPAPPPPYVPEFLGGAPGQEPPPSLNVVIHVVGSRGDVQPFVALGKVLKDTYGHRVRLATHPTFKDFVTENGLEFFSIGGDPAELMAFMVKNPGLMPGFDTLRSGEVGKRRKGIAEMLRGTWRSCIETGDGLSVDPLKQTVEEWMGIEEQLPEQLKKPFVADAIIANPPSFGHIHCAEKLGIPLHMMFTMPWSPTQQFPHPLANVQSSNADPTLTNFMSYILVDMLTWQGLGDVVNRFRKESLGLDPISMIWAPAVLARLKVPWTYCWSPALIPKPADWGHHISISGFYFLNLASNYTPAPDLAEFLAAGEPPVYIGFGSIVVDDPNAMTTLIFDAVKLTGRRALVSKGWGGLGGDELQVPEGVFMLGNVPHDWLFKHVSAVVHHGGAGTTAAGIAAGRPTVVVPFFGDQPFWGAMTARAGAGPDPVPYKDLTAEKLADAIKKALEPESLERAKELSEKISQEQGSQNGAQSFHQMLKYDDLRCAVAPKNPAVWRVKRTQVRLSAQAATVLAQEGVLNFSELKLFRPREYVPDEGPWDPFSGAASALLGTATQMVMGVADFPIETLKLLNVHPDSSKGKGKAKQTDSDSTSDPARKSRSKSTKTTTSTLPSAASSSTTLPGVQTPGSPDQGRRSLSELPGVSSPGSPGTPTHRSTFMAEAMRQSTHHSRSPSRDRHNHLCPTEHFRRGHRPGQSRSRSISAAELHSNAGTAATDRTFSDKLGDMNADSVIGTGKGIGRIVGAGFKSPMDFSLNVAKGFHNVPRLYGADVRQVDKVTDFQSGLRTAAKEFGLGLYDGIAGIVVDPYKGAKKEGGVGFVKGVGRGIFSVPWRVMGGAFSVPAYAMKGLYQEMLKGKGATVQNYIIAARISQGYDEAETISAEERADIISRWKCIRLNVKKKKNPGEEQMEQLHTIMQQRRKKRREKWAKINSHFKRHESTPSFPPSSENHSYSDLPEVVSNAGTDTTPGAIRQPFVHNLHHANTFPQPAPSSRHLVSDSSSVGNFANEEFANEEAERQELEAAIAASVAETSRGNPDEDELIARAIRASAEELQRVTVDDENDDEHALQRAMTASIEEAQRSGASEEEQKALEETLRQSLLEPHRRRQHRQHTSDSEWDSSDDEFEDDEEYQRILAESKELAHLHQASSHDEYFSTIAGAHQAQQEVDHEEEEALRKAIEESEKAEKARIELLEKHQPEGAGEEDALKKAIEESERAEKERREHLEKQKTEEDIVMEYVKKQSLAEEQHRRRLDEGRDTHGESSSSGAGKT